jgi:hypothetical protein
MNEPHLATSGDAHDSVSPPNAAAPGGGEIRLSFGFFYVVLKWGHEKRSAARLDEDRKAFPALTSTHVPVLIGTWAALFMALYALLKLGIESLVYLFSS